ncbi:unnamed protein product, partial [Ixodes hexagonus]
KFTERKRLVVSDTSISLETRAALLQRIVTEVGDATVATVGSSPPPSADADTSFDGDATLVASPPPCEPEHHPRAVPRRQTLTTGRRCGAEQEREDALPVAAGNLAPRVSGAHFKKPWQPLERAPPAKAEANLSQGSSLPFRAKPVPVRILTDEYRQKKKAEEEVRQLRAKARAEEMLRCSAVPFSARQPAFRRQSSTPVPNVPAPGTWARQSLSKASQGTPAVPETPQDCKKTRRRSHSCPRLEPRTPSEKPARPP